MVSMKMVVVCAVSICYVNVDALHCQKLVLLYQSNSGYVKES